MEKYLKSLLDAGKITQEEYDEGITKIPENPAAWKALSTRYKNEVAKANAERDAALAREAEKDAIISSFATAGNPNYNADADPMASVVEYINKKRGIKQ